MKLMESEISDYCRRVLQAAPEAAAAMVGPLTTINLDTLPAQMQKDVADALHYAILGLPASKTGAAVASV